MGVASWLVGIVAAGSHIGAYWAEYTTIIGSFTITFALKKLIKTQDSELASVFGLGGYALTVAAIFGLIFAVCKNGFGIPVLDLPWDIWNFVSGR